MRFLLQWLRIERPPGVALHPSRVVNVALSVHAAYARCVEIVEQTLGGHVTSQEPPRSFEAAFGLVNSERITVSIQTNDDGGSTIRLQSRRLANAAATPESAYLARFEKELAGAD